MLFVFVTININKISLQVENQKRTIDHYEKKGSLSNEVYKSASDQVKELDTKYKRLLETNNRQAEQIKCLQSQTTMHQKTITDHLAVVCPHCILRERLWRLIFAFSGHQPG
jgi:two-component SAPR family response regulator